MIERKPRTVHKSRSVPMPMKDVIAMLVKRGVRLEDIASRARVSFSLVCSWKYGAREPIYAMKRFLEHEFGVKIADQRKPE